MLWNIVFEFYIKYIFGGKLGASRVYDGILGVNDNQVNISTAKIGLTIFDNSICIGNYLSFIATIISMVVILVLCCMFIKKIYNMCAHIIG